MTDLGAQSARRQFLIGLAALAGLYAVIFGPAVVNSLRVLFDPGADIWATGWARQVATLEWDVFVVVVALAVVLRWLPRHAPGLARRMQTGRAHRVPGGIVATAAAYIGIALVSGWLGDHLVAALRLPHHAYAAAGRGATDLVLGTAAGSAAALTEELVLVALAVAVIDQHWTTRRPRWAAAATIALLLALRWLPHLYYGWGSVFVLLWVPGVYLLYRWVGSVWPLVLGHAAYDLLLTAERAYPTIAPALGQLMWAIAAFGAGTVAVSVLRSSRGQPDSVQARCSASASTSGGWAPEMP
jgi:hypothetical protein